jgi:putative ABC transport system ATP-binding protein
MDPIIRVTNLWKHYGGDGENGMALRGTNLEVFPGQIVALFGKSGSGKTTLLNLLTGLDSPTKGSVEIDGKNLDALGEAGRTELRRTRVGFVFQFFNLLPTLTAFENVSLSLELAGRPDEKAVAEALESVGLAGKERRYPYALSGGEQQRVAIARALVKKPAIILADEPTGNLDSATGEAILDLLVGRSRDIGTTLIMVSHSVTTCRYADRVYRMLDGALVEETCESLTS